MSGPDKPKPAPLVTLAETLMEAAAEQEVAVMTALQTGLQIVAHPAAKLRSEAEIEADQDNMPI